LSVALDPTPTESVAQSSEPDVDADWQRVEFTDSDNTIEKLLRAARVLLPNTPHAVRRALVNAVWRRTENLIRMGSARHGRTAQSAFPPGTLVSIPMGAPGGVTEFREYRIRGSESSLGDVAKGIAEYLTILGVEGSSLDAQALYRAPINILYRQRNPRRGDAYPITDRSVPVYYYCRPKEVVRVKAAPGAATTTLIPSNWRARVYQHAFDIQAQADAAMAIYGLYVEEVEHLFLALTQAQLLQEFLAVYTLYVDQHDEDLFEGNVVLSLEGLPEKLKAFMSQIDATLDGLRAKRDLDAKLEPAHARLEQLLCMDADPEMGALIQHLYRVAGQQPETYSHLLSTLHDATHEGVTALLSITESKAILERLGKALDVTQAPDAPGLTLVERAVARARVDVENGMSGMLELNPHGHAITHDQAKAGVRIARNALRYVSIHASISTWRLATEMLNRLEGEDARQVAKILRDRTLLGAQFLRQVKAAPGNYLKMFKLLWIEGVDAKKWSWKTGAAEQWRSETNQLAKQLKANEKAFRNKMKFAWKVQFGVTLSDTANFALVLFNDDKWDAKRTFKASYYGVSTTKDLLAHTLEYLKKDSAWHSKVDKLSKIFGPAAAFLAVVNSVWELIEGKNRLSNLASLMQNSATLVTTIADAPWLNARFLRFSRGAAILEAVGSLLALIDVAMLGYVAKKAFEDPPGTQIFVRNGIANLKHLAGKLPEKLGHTIDHELIPAFQAARFHPLDWHERSIKALRAFLPRDMVLELVSGDMKAGALGPKDGHVRTQNQYLAHKALFWE
jgi:hypothetical protein